MSKSNDYHGERLLPCPFCGAMDHSTWPWLLEETRDGSTVVYVQCSNCGARGRRTIVFVSGDLTFARASARLAWNMRAALVNDNLPDEWPLLLGDAEYRRFQRLASDEWVGPDGFFVYARFGEWRLYYPMGTVLTDRQVFASAQAAIDYYWDLPT